MHRAENTAGFDYDRLFRLSSAYLAPVSYYQLLANAPGIWIDVDENYQRQSYRNRCIISASNGPLTLSIPVEKPVAGKLAMRDIRIADHGDWQKTHWRTIETAYSSSPFFEFYQDDFIPFYEKKWDFLLDFNMALQSKMLELVDISTKIVTENLELDAWQDFREIIHPKKQDVVNDYTSYYQVFSDRQEFSPGLSIIDLLMNMGNESVLILKKKKSVYLHKRNET